MVEIDEFRKAFGVDGYKALKVVDLIHLARKYEVVFDEREFKKLTKYLSH